MFILGMAVSFCAFLLDGLLILRGGGTRLFKRFPLFYSYLVYAFCGSLGMYVIYWRFPRFYPSAFWIYYLVSILVEFTVVVEISDQIFKSFPAIRSLGRALAIVISSALGLFYMLPVVFESSGKDIALFDFALRASVTKAAVLAVLLFVARHYGSQLGRNVAGLMLGFSIYLGVNVANLAAAKVFGPALYGGMLWIMTPLAYTLCLLVWTIALWELAPMPAMSTISLTPGRDSQAVALELNRFNSAMSKFIRK